MQRPERTTERQRRIGRGGEGANTIQNHFKSRYRGHTRGFHHRQPGAFTCGYDRQLDRRAHTRGQRMGMNSGTVRRYI